MSYKFEFSLPGLPRMQNPSGRGTHWAVISRESQQWKYMVGVAVSRNRPAKPLHRAKLTLTRVSAVSPDSDGLVSGFKRIIDGLVESKVLLNDRVENIGMPTYLWKKGKSGKGYLRVLIEEIVEQKR
jgi:hypothetical protein